MLRLVNHAVRNCSKAIELSLDYRKVIHWRAELYNAYRHLNQAKRDFCRVLELDPHHPMAPQAGVSKTKGIVKTQAKSEGIIKTQAMTKGTAKTQAKTKGTIKTQAQSKGTIKTQAETTKLEETATQTELEGAPFPRAATQAKTKGTVKTQAKSEGHKDPG